MKIRSRLPFATFFAFFRLIEKNYRFGTFFVLFNHLGPQKGCEVVNRSRRGCVGSSHAHVKAIHHVNAVDLATVETSAELDQVGTPLELAPLLVESHPVQAKLFACIGCVVHLAGGNSVVPLETERLGERILSLLLHDQLGGLLLWFRVLQLEIPQ